MKMPSSRGVYQFFGREVGLEQVRNRGKKTIHINNASDLLSILHQSR